MAILLAPSLQHGAWAYLNVVNRTSASAAGRASSLAMSTAELDTRHHGMLEMDGVEEGGGEGEETKDNSLALQLPDIELSYKSGAMVATAAAAADSAWPPPPRPPSPPNPGCELFANALLFLPPDAAAALLERVAALDGACAIDALAHIDRGNPAATRAWTLGGGVQVDPRLTPG